MEKELEMDKGPKVANEATDRPAQYLRNKKSKAGRAPQIAQAAEVIEFLNVNSTTRNQSRASCAWRTILAFVILLPTFAPRNKALGATNNPPGAYQTTCQDVQVVGTTLTATCRNASGQLMPPSSLANFDQCIGEIQNYDGQLRCNMGSTPPPGAYTETCRFIFVSGTTLNANCKNTGGKWVAQTYLPNFNRCIGEIQNYNGQLHCNMGLLPPSGPYTETCRYIFTSGATLTANCKNAGGKFTAQTFLPNFNQCIGKIQNYDGQLHCNVGSMPPSGSYTQTCRYIFTSGTTLNATCANAGGKWAPSTSLPHFDQCAGTILNVDGVLQCSIH